MGVFTSRVRDVAGEVRVESLTALGDWRVWRGAVDQRLFCTQLSA